MVYIAENSESCLATKNNNSGSVHSVSPNAVAIRGCAHPGAPSGKKLSRRYSGETVVSTLVVSDDVFAKINSTET